MEKEQSTFKVIGKPVLIFLLIFFSFKLIFFSWGEKYEYRHGMIEYNYGTGSGWKSSGHSYFNIKLAGNDTIYGLYAKYKGAEAKKTIRDIDRLKEGDTVTIYFKKGEICDYRVTPRDKSSLYMDKQEIEDSKIINIAGITSKGKLILDPQNRKYYNPSYYWVVWLQETFYFISISILLVLVVFLLVRKFAPNYMKEMAKASKQSRENIK